MAARMNANIAIIPKHTDGQARLAALVAAVDDVYAVSLMTHIYLTANERGEVYASNEVMAELCKMSVSKLKELKRDLSRLGYITYRARRVSLTRNEVTVWALGGLPEGAEKPDAGREKTRRGAHGGYNMINDMNDDDDDLNISTYINQLGEKAKKAFNEGYNNRADVHKFETVPDVIFEGWIEQAKNANNGGALLNYLFRQWAQSGQPGDVEIPEKPEDADVYTSGDYADFIDTSGQKRQEDAEARKAAGDSEFAPAPVVCDVCGKSTSIFAQGDKCDCSRKDSSRST